ncbi:hypothetical protein VNO80_01730 [Phaseolus coccineus]|uniref:TIR domain-containing protein n=1 Tax=Phaseolus coccineus TaxID=3886 RepID=A0AAN9RT47_PHACN
MKSTASSSCNTHWIHDVFLNFRGDDTRETFVSHLYAALSNAGINTFIDDNIFKGTVLGAELVRAIQGSQISIVVFSDNYASSKWCLNELVEIMECRRAYGQKVVPLFYDVDPSHVRYQKGDFGKRLEALAQNCLPQGLNDDVLRSWKTSLTAAANIAGWDARNFRSEDELVKQIVEDITEKVDNDFLSIPEFPVGLEWRAQELIEEIIRESSRKEPGKRSRLWLNEDVVKVLTENTGTEAVEGLALTLHLTSRDCFEAYAFEAMKRLRLLQLDHVQLSGDYGYLSKHLRWVCWHGFPSKYIPNNFSLKDVIAIDLRHSNIRIAWKQPQNNDSSDLAPILSSLSNLRSVFLQCDKDFQLSKQVQTILDEVYGGKFTQLDISSYHTEQISKHSLRSYLIGIGTYQEVLNTLSNSISEGLATNESCDVFLPSDNYPYWLAHTGEGHSVYFTVPEDCCIKGMTLCVVYLSAPENTAAELLTSVLVVNYSKCTIQIYKRETVISFNDEDWQGIISHLGYGDKIEIFVTFGNGLVVKKTIVYLLCDESIEMEMEPFPEPKKKQKKSAFAKFIKKIVMCKIQEQ